VRVRVYGFVYFELWRWNSLFWTEIQPSMLIYISWTGSLHTMSILIHLGNTHDTHTIFMSIFIQYYNAESKILLENGKPEHFLVRRKNACFPSVSG